MLYFRSMQRTENRNRACSCSILQYCSSSIDYRIDKGEERRDHSLFLMKTSIEYLSVLLFSFFEMETREKSTDNGAPSSNSIPLLVIAKHNFEGRNNDELSFNKNDVITVTQKLEGGWWEGSLDGRIGWFPSNFVGLVNVATTASPSKGTARNIQQPDPLLEASRMAYRSEQINNFIAKEQENQQKIDQLLRTLKSLMSEGRGTISHYREFSSITKSLADFVALKHTLLKQFEEQTKRPVNCQFIGKLFLDLAVELRTILFGYCRRHCDLLDFLNRDSNTIHQQLSAHKIGFNELIVGLSLVFRHVDKYARILQEIERNTPDGHPDKGNLHRASSVYRDFYNECEKIRRQREAQIDFIRTGVLETTLGAQFEKELGSFLYIGKVTATESNANDEGTEVDRCITIFERSILLLEICTTGCNELKNRYATNSLSIQRHDSNKEICINIGGKKKMLILRTMGRDDYMQLVEALKSCVGLELRDEDGTTLTIKTNKKGGECSMEGSDAVDEGFCIAEKDNAVTSFAGNIRVNHQLEMILPDAENPQSSENPINNAIAESSANKPYSGWALRPYPPHRAEWLPTSTQTASVKMRKGLSSEEQEDALMLKIIEGYFISGPGSSASPNRKPYQQRNSAESCHSPYGGGPVRRAASYPDQHEIARPQLIVAEDEKLFVEEMEGDQLVLKERSLVDTVYSLRDQISVLTKEVSNISKALEQEQRARRRVEELLRQQQNGKAINCSMTNQQQQHSAKPPL